MEAPRIERLIGVFHADGGLVGELRYVVGKWIGRTHCSLCDVTHRGISPRPEWLELVGRLSVPVVLVHLNERTKEVREACEGQTPCVLAEMDGSLVLVLGPADLEACHGDVGVFEGRLAEALAALGELPT